MSRTLIGASLAVGARARGGAPRPVRGRRRPRPRDCARDRARRRLASASPSSSATPTTTSSRLRVCAHARRLHEDGDEFRCARAAQAARRARRRCLGKIGGGGRGAAGGADWLIAARGAPRRGFVAARRARLSPRRRDATKGRAPTCAGKPVRRAALRASRERSRACARR